MSFKCDGMCAGDDLGDCSHPEASLATAIEKAVREEREAGWYRLSEEIALIVDYLRAARRDDNPRILAEQILRGEHRK